LDKIPCELLINFVLDNQITNIDRLIVNNRAWKQAFIIDNYDHSTCSACNRVNQLIKKNILDKNNNEFQVGK